MRKTLIAIALAAVLAPIAAQAQTRVSDFSQDMTALGTEPFWNLKIVGTTFTLSRAGKPALVAKAPGANIASGKASWTATSANGVMLQTTLYVSPCSDGMSDRSYPMTAEVTVDGATLRGCAAKTAAMPK